MYHIESVKSELPYYQEILLFYKVNPCHLDHHAGESLPMGHAYSEFFCFNYHNPSERRRTVFDEATSSLLYQPIKCTSIVETAVCPNGDLCRFAHTQNEIDYHPAFYKTEPCKGCFYESNAKFCPFYHADETSRKVLLEKFKAKTNKETLKNQPNLPPMAYDPASLENFKAKPCPLKGNHNPKVCEYYHHEKDRKRPVSIYHYTPNLCPYGRKEEPCSNGDSCKFSHNKVEQLYHPERYKKKFCLSHPHNIHKCEYGNYCSFAHSESEIQIELLHNLKKDENFYLYKYKTVFCPYIYEHDRNQCVYAHNPQDFRRSPNEHTYNPIQCPFWSQGQIFSYEDGGCPKVMHCENCHGWKELEFHPLYYKTKPCNNGKKCTKKDCPFYHSSAERREPKFNPSISQPFTQSQVAHNLPPPVQKGYTGIHEADPNLPQFGFEGSRSSKGGKKKESHYMRPIMPVYVPVHKQTEPQRSYEPKMQRFGESSTRPNSNISSLYFSEEERPSHEGPGHFKKRKSKNMSLQGKKEKTVSPLSSKSDKPKGQATKEAYQVPPNITNIWESTKHEDEKAFEEMSKKFVSVKLGGSENKADDSFESLHSYTVEKNAGASDKAAEVVNDQFLKTLFSNLEKKGLEYTIPYLKSPNIDLETLKSFNQRNFHLLPQISKDDKEKIVKIIQDILEGEAIWSDIKNIHEEPQIIPASQQQKSPEESSLYGNFGGSEGASGFDISSFFQKRPY